MAAPTKKQLQSDSTRRKLIAVARRLFATRGYAGTSIIEITAKAKVTRGALYHHFADKRALFRALHERMEADLMERIGAQLAEFQGDDPADALRAGLRSYLDACADPSFARITLVDAPAVLGWDEWRRIDEQYALKLTEAGLEGAMESGALKRQPVRPLAQLMMAAMGEAGLRVANSDDPERTRREIEPPLLAWIDGLRP